MTSPALRYATWLSTVMLGLTLVLCIASHFLNPWDHYVSIGERFQVAIGGFGGDSLGRVIFFNDREYGPYRGSILQLSDINGRVPPIIERKVAFGDSLGIYCRYFRWFDGSTLWTLMISFWHPLVLFSILPVLALYRRYQRVPSFNPEPSATASGDPITPL